MNLKITPEMIQAGVRALHEEIGHDFNGWPEDVVQAVFARMLSASKNDDQFAQINPVSTQTQEP